MSRRTSWSLDPAPFTDDKAHTPARHALTQRRKYARWLDSEDDLIVANAMLLIIGRALNMVRHPDLGGKGDKFDGVHEVLSPLTSV